MASLVAFVGAGLAAYALLGPMQAKPRDFRFAFKAASVKLRIGVRVLVRSLQTGREVAVRIVDRGPHLKNRIIDLSHAAAAALGIKGTAALASHRGVVEKGFALLVIAVGAYVALGR